MNKTENNHTKPSRAIWFWCVGFLALLLLFVAIAIPIVMNYRAIKHLESLGVWARVTTEPCSMFEALPESWQEWLRSSLGDRIQSIETVKSIFWGNSSINDDDLRYLKRFTKLTHLYIGNTQISDAGLIHLKGLTNVTFLDIANTQISNKGIDQLRNALPNCLIHYSRSP